MWTPIRSFIESKMKIGGISRSVLVKKMGYRNVNHGLRRLDSLLDTLNAPDIQFSRRLAFTLDIDKSSLTEAIKAIDEVINAEARAVFRPHIYIHIHERITPLISRASFSKHQRFYIPLKWTVFDRENECNAVSDCSMIVRKWTCLSVIRLLDSHISDNTTSLLISIKVAVSLFLKGVMINEKF